MQTYDRSVTDGAWRVCLDVGCCYGLAFPPLDQAWKVYTSRKGHSAIFSMKEIPYHKHEIMPNPPTNGCMDQIALKMNRTQNIACPYGPEFEVYWNMRYRLFSKFDQAMVDATGLYTMVPETSALDMAGRSSGSRALDLCSGVGSMSVALARSGQRVTAVEIDQQRVAMAKHNAQIYGVADLIDFRQTQGEKIAYVTRKGYLHWYFMRMPKQQFIGIPDKSASVPGTPASREGITAHFIQN